MSIKELDSQVKELRELRRMAEELQAEIEAIQDKIKAHMTAQNVDTLTGTDYKIIWKEVKSSRFDSKAFKATHAELYGQYTRETSTRRFTVA